MGEIAYTQCDKCGHYEDGRVCSKETANKFNRIVIGHISLGWEHMDRVHYINGLNLGLLCKECQQRLVEIIIKEIPRAIDGKFEVSRIVD